MSPFAKRLIRRCVGVAVALAIIGYIFAEVFLVLMRMNGGVSDAGNEAVRWKTPLTMAGIGVVLQVAIELVAFAIRPKRAPTINHSVDSQVSNAPTT